MKGLYSAIETQESSHLRPLGDMAMEIRLHQRRAVWAQIWINPRHRVKPEAMAKLKQEAPCQAQQGGATTQQTVQKATNKRLNKAGGPDGITAPFLKHLHPTQVAELAELLAEWEKAAFLPDQVRQILVAMLPKKADKERPKGQLDSRP